MKKTLALAAALTVLWTASTMAAPVATIELNTYGPSSNPIMWVNASGATVLAPLDGTYVELVAAGAVVKDITSGATTIPMAEDGQIYGGIGVIPGIAAGGTTDFTLRAWRGATSWDAATEKGFVTWSQAAGSYDAAGVPPPILGGATLNNPAGLVIAVPEPSTIALGLLGGLGLLFFRRK